MGEIVSALMGRKTYIAAYIGIAVLLAVNLLSIPILGMEPDPNWFEKVWGLVLVITGRAAIAKLE